MQHIVQLQAMGVLARQPVKDDSARGSTPEALNEEEDQSLMPTSFSQHQGRGRMGGDGGVGAATPSASASPFSHRENMAVSLSRAASAQHQSFFHSLGPTGNFDFALYIGADERLIAYVASLDLPFAPLTVTTANIDLRGSEAGFCLPVGNLGSRCSKQTRADSPHEDDARGGQQEGGGVLEALKELVAFRRRDMRWGRSGSEI